MPALQSTKPDQDHHNHHMQLMKYAPTDWLDVVAMRVDRAASSWVNAVLQEVADGQ